MSRADARNDMVNERHLVVAGGTTGFEAFPASFELKLRDDVTDGQVAAIAQKLRAVPSVDAVETYERWTERLASLLKGGVMASVILGFVVLAAVISVIGATMRLALHRRRNRGRGAQVGRGDRPLRERSILGRGRLPRGRSARARRSLFWVCSTWWYAGRFDDNLGLLLGVNPSFCLGNRGGDDCLGGLARRSFGVCRRATPRLA